MNILVDVVAYKKEWKETKPKQKGKAYSKATQERPKISYKMQLLSSPKKVLAAYYQLKLGKGFLSNFLRL